MNDRLPRVEISIDNGLWALAQVVPCPLTNDFDRSFAVFNTEMLTSVFRDSRRDPSDGYVVHATKSSWQRYLRSCPQNAD